MDTLQILQNIWFLLIGVLFVGYSVLDGFDLGIGMFLPFASKSDEDTSALFHSIGPVWDGNEVWLLTAGGALFAAFPHTYATVFSGFYLALMLVLFSLIFRAVSIEFWFLDESRKAFWKACVFIGSLIPSLLFGVALGNVILGIPMDSNMEFTGSFFTLLRPMPLAIGLLGMAAILMQGVTYGVIKTTGHLQDTIRTLGRSIWIACIVLFVVAMSVSIISMGISRIIPLTWIFSAISMTAIVATGVLLSRRSDFASFVASSISFAGLWAIAAALQYPRLVASSGDDALSLTIYNTSSSLLTLKVMLIIALTGMPLVIAYTIFVYRIFRGKSNA